jgi:hypothetical protein
MMLTRPARQHHSPVVILAWSTGPGKPTECVAMVDPHHLPAPLRAVEEEESMVLGLDPTALQATGLAPLRNLRFLRKCVKNVNCVARSAVGAVAVKALGGTG